MTNNTNEKELYAGNFWNKDAPNQILPVFKFNINKSSDLDCSFIHLEIPLLKAILNNQYPDGYLDGLYKGYNQNNDMVVRFVIKNGMFTHELNKFHDNHIAKSHYQLGNDVIDGCCKSWHPNNTKRIYQNINNNKRCGNYEEWYSDGQPKIKTSYKFGFIDGIYEEYGTDGKIIKYKTYKMGKLHGHYRDHSNGQRVVLCYYTNDKLDGLYSVSILLNNELVLVEQCQFKDGVRNGLSESYTDGKLSISCNYLDDEFHGQFTQYYNNSQSQRNQIWNQCNYSHGERHGQYNEWYENGNLKSTVHYVDDFIDSYQIEWYSDGQLKTSTLMVNGKCNGIYQHWYPDGQLQYHCTYVNGKIDGTFNSWDNDGVLTTQLIKNGVKIINKSLVNKINVNNQTKRKVNDYDKTEYTEAKRMKYSN
jgi:antitoxin component YwqK of YwqJK toxin-antitoxin module